MMTVESWEGVLPDHDSGELGGVLPDDASGGLGGGIT